MARRQFIFRGNPKGMVDVSAHGGLREISTHLRVSGMKYLNGITRLVTIIYTLWRPLLGR